MDGYLQTAIGIAVSILLFLLSYRQTIGAKKERTKNANKSIHRAIMRRMVLEDYTPKYKDLTRIIEGKAREFNTSINDMLSEEQLLNSIYTEVFDNDLISPSQRIDIENRLDNLFKNMEEKELESSNYELDILKKQKQKASDSLISIVLLTSTLGALTSMLYDYLQNPPSLHLSFEQFANGITVFIASLSIISLILTLRKEKDDVSNSSKRSSILESVTFESNIEKAIKKAKYKYKTEVKLGTFYIDFIIEENNKKIGIEVKNWNKKIHPTLIKRTLERLENLINNQSIDDIILITKEQISDELLSTLNSKIKIYTYDEFTKLLTDRKLI